jgi:hypothetical protein
MCNDQPIGVLTKPDQLRLPQDEGLRNEYTTLLQNQGHGKLNHGWFVCRLSESRGAEANYSWKKARKVEKEFFDNHRPDNWLSGIPENYRSRFGIENLANKLILVLFEKSRKRCCFPYQNLETIFG